MSNIGTWMQRTAQDWLVLIQLTDHDATALGGTPPIVGWIADHFGPRWALGIGGVSGFGAALVGAGTC